MAWSKDYSLSIDFSGNLLEVQLQCEIYSNVTITTALLGIETIDDVVTCIFESEPSAAEKTELDSVVAAHTPLTPSQRFPRVLADANDILEGMDFVDRYLEAPTTLARTYTMPPASELVACSMLTGAVHIINTGSADAIIGASAGMTSVGNMTVSSGTSGYFQFKVTDETPASEAFTMLRLA